MSMAGHIAHVALWVEDLESMRAFYTQALGGVAGDLYENPSTGFKSYFISFGEGPRLELMSRPDVGRRPLEPSQIATGYAHIALTLGVRQTVDTTVAGLREKGVTIVSEPRLTGDGYYEAVILDPEGNQVEIVA